MFNAKKVKNDLVQWIRNWFEENGPGCNCVCGISGGKDSSVVAALCVEALGKDRVIGVLMPGAQPQDVEAHELCRLLDIKEILIDITTTIDSIRNGMRWAIVDGAQGLGCGIRISNQALTNLPPRIRMATLYAVSQSMNGRVSNNCNLSEDWVGYSTRYGDAAGDFSPLANLTVGEVKAIGYELGLPKHLIEKTPADGLCGKTDEDNLGFTYEVLDKYIRTGVCEDPDVKARIDERHRKNLFKLQPMPSFPYTGHIGCIEPTELNELI